RLPPGERAARTVDPYLPGSRGFLAQETLVDSRQLCAGAQYGQGGCGQEKNAHWCVKIPRGRRLQRGSVAPAPRIVPAAQASRGNIPCQGTSGRAPQTGFAAGAAERPGAGPTGARVAGPPRDSECESDRRRIESCAVSFGHLEVLVLEPCAEWPPVRLNAGSPHEARAIAVQREQCAVGPLQIAAEPPAHR